MPNKLLPDSLQEATTAPIRQKSSSLADVARAAGVTKAAASFAFSGKRKISPETRERIFNAARQLDYHPNPHAQRLSAGIAHKMIGLFSLNLNNVSWQSMSHLHHELASRGYEAPLYTYGFSLKKSPQYEALLRSLCRQLPEGMICNTFELPQEAGGHLQTYQANGGVLVCINEQMPVNCDQVLFDREANTYLAAQHLVQAGHRDIGLCTLYVDDLTGERQRGFVRALQEVGVAPRKEWLFEAGINEEGGAWLAERFLALKERPTAVCIVNDVQAAAFVNEVLRAGLRVPEDVSVVALDGLPASLYSMVRITTVTQPWEQMTAEALNFLLERLRKSYEGEPRKLVFSGEVIARESVRRL